MSYSKTNVKQQAAPKGGSKKAVNTKSVKSWGDRHRSKIKSK